MNQRCLNVSNYISKELDIKGVPYNLTLETDNGGYLYSCSTPFGFGVFSDSNSSGVIYFVGNVKKIEWGEKEGFVMGEIPAYKETDLRNFISFLSSGVLIP